MRRSLSICSFLLLITLTGCSFTLAADVTPPPGYQPLPELQTESTQASGRTYPLVAPDPADGALIYSEKCAPCHGDTGHGDGFRAAQLPNPVPAIGTPEIARQSYPSKWYNVVTEVNMDRFMPPFASLTDRERWDVIAYVYALSASEDVIAHGGELYQENCARCHGKTGKGDGPDATGLATPLPDFTDQAFMAEKSEVDFFEAVTNGGASTGGTSTMPAYADQLPEGDRWALASYLRGISFVSSGQVTASKITPVPTGTTETWVQTTPAITTSLEVTPVAGTSEITTTQSTGLISGTVTNGSGGELAPNMTITLHGFDNMNVAITDTTKLQPDGVFVFQDIEMPAGRAFIATTEFSQATYGSDVVTVEDGHPVPPLAITVYDTTSDVSSLSVDRLHIFFDFSNPDTIQVIQLYILSNSSNKVIIPAEDGSAVVNFTLPEGASNLQFQDGALGGRYVSTPDGFGDTAAVSPGMGEHQVVFAYEMPYSRKIDLVEKQNLPVNAVVVLVPESGVKVKSDMLEDAGSRDFQGATYHMYSGDSLGSGSQLSMTLTGRPGTTGLLSASSDTRYGLAIGLGAFGVVLVVTGVLLYRRNKRKDEIEVESDGSSDESESEQTAEGLMDAIIALDDIYKAGQIPEDAYHQRRAELKGQLKGLIE